MAKFTTLDFIDLLFRTYGHALLFILSSLIATLIVLRKAFSSRRSVRVEEIFFSLLFSVLSIFYIATLLGSFLGTGRSLRIYTWALTASTILNGVIFQVWISGFKGNKLRIGVYLLTIIIIVAMVIGVFSVFPSPYTRVANSHSTQMDWNAMEWFFEHKSPDTTIHLTNQLAFRAPGAIFGIEAPKPQTVGAFSFAPPHFGYDGSETLAYSFDSSRYIVITQFDIVTFTKLWPDVEQRVNSADFNRLNFDPAVSKVYYNGELEIWRVSTAKK